MSLRNEFGMEKLTSKNYFAWKFVVESMLNKEGIDITENIGDAKLKGKARRIIRSTVSKEVIPFIMEEKNPTVAWEMLESKYGTVDEDSRFSKMMKLFSLVKGQQETVSSFTSRARLLFNDINTLKREGNIPMLHEDLLLIAVVNGMPKDFKKEIKKWPKKELTMVNLEGKLEVFCNEIKGEDKRTEILHTKKEKTESHRKDRSCFKCGKIGHYVAKCPEKKSVNIAEVLTVSSSSCLDVKWIIDSGASDHICCESALFSELDYSYSKSKIRVADGRLVNIGGRGTVSLIKYGLDSLTNVLFVPEMKRNLLSVSCLNKQHYEVQFNKAGCSILKDGQHVGRAEKMDGLYKLVAVCKVVSPLMHERLGHLSAEGMKKLGFVSSSKTVCKECLEGEHKAKPFKKEEAKIKTFRTLELIHSDICGPMESLTYGGAKYVLTFIDDYSRFSWIFLLKKKSETLQQFKYFKAQVESEKQMQISSIKTDGGGEYSSNRFEELCSSEGIKHLVTAPYRHQQNGIAERLNRTLLVKARSMLFRSRQSVKLWGEVINTANYLRNICFCRTVGRTPYEVWTGRKPNYSSLKIWGCVGYVRVPKEKRRKWDRQSSEMIFVGYDATHYGFRMFDPESKRITISRDVVFDETKFQVQSSMEDREELAKFFSVPEVEEDEILMELEGEEDEISLPPVLGHDSPTSPVLTITSKRSDKVSEGRKIMQIADGTRELGKRAVKKPVKLDLNVEQIFHTFIPKSYKEAVTCEQKQLWIKAMDEEMKSISDNDVWELVNTKTVSQKPVSVKWVFTIKKNENGEVERYKARLVAKGYTQVKGIDYFETFSPVVRQESLRVLLNLAVLNGCCVRQLDIRTAFLNGVLEEDIYIKQPNGYEDGTKRICKLKKALYGLKQAPRVWNFELMGFLSTIGFQQIQSDNCILINNIQTVYISVYVDDILVIGAESEVNKIVENLKNKFDTKDLGEINFLLGIKVEKLQKGLWLSQSVYAKELLERFSMSNCKPVSTPSDANVRLSKSQSPNTAEDREIMKNVPFREAIGGLNYLCTCTRPDIATAVSLVSKFSNNPGEQHWKAVKRIFRYIRGTFDYGILVQPENSQLIGYADANWAEDADTRRSQSGYCFLIGGSVVSWKSKLQQTISLSTMESEYKALAFAVQELLWLKCLLEELGVRQECVTILEDNQACISFSNNPIFHGRAKHIDIKYHFIRENIKRNTMKLVFCPTEEMVADMFTKPVGKAKLEACRDALKIQKVTLQEEY